MDGQFATVVNCPACGCRCQTTGPVDVDAEWILMSKTGWPSRTGIGSPSGDPKNLTAKSANCSFGVALNWRQQGTGRRSDCLKRSGRLPTSHLTLNPTLGTRPDRPERNASRALRVQLARVNTGHSPLHSISLLWPPPPISRHGDIRPGTGSADREQRRSGHTGPRETTTARGDWLPRRRMPRQLREDRRRSSPPIRARCSIHPYRRLLGPCWACPGVTSRRSTAPQREGLQRWLLKAASKDWVEGVKLYLRSAARASGAPSRRSMPASSHSMEIGPS